MRADSLEVVLIAVSIAIMHRWKSRGVLSFATHDLIRKSQVSLYLSLTFTSITSIIQFGLPYSLSAVLLVLRDHFSLPEHCRCA